SNTASSDDAILVVCRVRPGRDGDALQRCVEVAADGRTVVLAGRPQNKLFTFDHSLGENATQEELFESVGKPVTIACLQGYNGTIFCYGQTGAGKTYTLFGPDAALDSSDATLVREQRGLVPRVLEFLFSTIAQRQWKAGGSTTFDCKCSFYEIFNESVFDLLDDRSAADSLAVREDARGGVYVEGLRLLPVATPEAAGSILVRGYRNRHVGETAMNRQSSRSHAVFTLSVVATEQHEDGLTRSRLARFNLVDLAGSERQRATHAVGDRLKEASSINKSLSTLGQQVISALVDKAQGRDRHVHYRDSKLTFLLRESLGGNSKTAIVAAVSPAAADAAETLSTLKFARRAKEITNQAVVNEDTRGGVDALRRQV
ncbi:unnamed protein product, partial [Phaeothamnion confervicola]